MTEFFMEENDPQASTCCRRAQEAAAASEQEAATAVAEAQQASLQADQAASEGAEDDHTHALRQAAAKWNKRYMHRCNLWACCCHTRSHKVVCAISVVVLHLSQLRQSYACWWVPIVTLQLMLGSTDPEPDTAQSFPS